jgi:hypothetical protein
MSIVRYLREHNVSETDSVRWLWLALSNWTARHRRWLSHTDMKTETDPFSETLCSLQYRTTDRVQKPSNPECPTSSWEPYTILSLVYPCINGSADSSVSNIIIVLVSSKSYYVWAPRPSQWWELTSRHYGYDALTFAQQVPAFRRDLLSPSSA